MTESEREARERHWVEEVGLVFERQGSVRMAGRILGRLLLCEPEQQSSQQLSAYLGASKASISTATRQLIQMGIVERIALPNDRASYFRIRPHAWAIVMEAGIAETLFIADLGERGLQLLSGRPEGSRRRMKEFVDLYRFMADEMPAMLEHWRARNPPEVAR